MSSLVAFLDVFVRFVIDSPCGCSSLEFVCHKFDLLLHKNISYVKEFIHLVDSIQEGFDIKIPAKRGDVKFHPVLLRIWVFSFPTMRVRVSSLPIGVRKYAFPIWIRISEPPMPSVG